MCDPAQTPHLLKEVRHFFTSRRDEQTFVSLENKRLLGEQHQRGLEPCRACRPTYGLQTGLQSALRSGSQARRRGLILSTSWSLWASRGHLRDTEPEGVDSVSQSPAGRFLLPAPHLGRDSIPSVGGRSLCPVTLHGGGKT